MRLLFDLTVSKKSSEKLLLNLTSRHTKINVQKLFLNILNIFFDTRKNDNIVDKDFCKFAHIF